MIAVLRLLLLLITSFGQISFFQPLRCIGHLGEKSCYSDELCHPVNVNHGPNRDEVGMPLYNRRFIFCSNKSPEKTPEIPKPTTSPTNPVVNLSATATPTPVPTSSIIPTPTTTTVTVVSSETPTILLPNNQTGTLKTGSIEVTSAESQVTFMLQVRDYPEYRATDFVFKVTDPNGEVLTPQNHLESGIYFVVENSYQLARFNLPRRLNGSWSYSVEGPLEANIEVRSMSF